MFRQSWKFALAVCGAVFVSAVGGDAGIRLSEWGTESLPEMSVPPESRDSAPELGLGDFLVDEARSFGAGALDGEQLRKMLADRAIGKDGAGVREWMANQWESAPGRFGAHLADYAAGRLESLSWVRDADVSWTPTADGFGAFSAGGVGGMMTGADSFFGIQPKIRRSGDGGEMFGTFGVFQRTAIGDWGVVGVNAFADYKGEARGTFSRYWLGADFASAWVDADVKRYFGGEGRTFRRGDSLFRAYTPDGLSAELRVHSPGLRRLEGYAKFAEWQGRGPNPDKSSHAYGVSFAPTAGWKADAEYGEGDAEFRVAYEWRLGGRDLLPASERFNVYSEIWRPVPEGKFTITAYKLRDAVYLRQAVQGYHWEMICEGDTYDDDCRAKMSDYRASIRARMSVSWELVEPDYMRISEDKRSQCPPPVFNVFDFYNPARYKELFDYWKDPENSPRLSDKWRPGYENSDTPEELGNFFRNEAVRENPCNALLSGMGPNENYEGKVTGAPEEFADANGDLLYLAAAEYANVDAVKLLVIADADKDSGGYWKADINEPRKVLEGVAHRLHLARQGREGGDDSWLHDRVVRLVTIARILRANNFDECAPEYANDDEYREGCNMDPDGWTAFDREGSEVHDGSLNRPAVKPVAEGYTGEILRITANTDYADVAYNRIDAQEGLFSFRLADGYKCFYTNCPDNDHECTESDLQLYSRFHNKSNDSKILVVSLTAAAEPEEYGMTIRAFFFHQIHDLNTEMMTVTVTVLADPPEESLNLSADASGFVFTLSHSIGALSFTQTDDLTSGIVISEDGRISVPGPLSVATTATLSADAVSPDNADMLGTLQFTVVARIGCSVPVAGDGRPQYKTDSNPTANRDLAAAVSGDNLDDLCEALAEGGDPRVAGEDGRTPLMMAAGSTGTDTAVFDALLAATDLQDIDKGQYETATGNPQSGARSLECGAQDECSYFTALHHAAGSGDGYRVEQLLKKGANPNAADHRGKTPIFHAIKEENLAGVRALADDENTNAGHMDSDGLGVPHRAVLSKNADIVAAVLTASALKADPNLKSSNIPSGSDLEESATPLHLAAGLENEGGIVEQLLQAGANPNAKDYRNQTPIFRAVAAENTAGVRALVGNKKTDADIVDEDGIGVLHRAVLSGNGDVVGALLADSAISVNPNFKTTAPYFGSSDVVMDDATALHFAANQENGSGIVEKLLTVGASVNATDSIGKTPIFYAVDKKNTAELQALASGGANVNHLDDEGLGIIHYAAVFGDNDLMNSVVGIPGIDLKLKTTKYYSYLGVAEGATAIDFASNSGKDGIRDIIQAALDKLEAEGGITSPNDDSGVIPKDQPECHPFCLPDIPNPVSGGGNDDPDEDSDGDDDSSGSDDTPTP